MFEPYFQGGYPVFRLRKVTPVPGVGSFHVRKPAVFEHIGYPFLVSDYGLIVGMFPALIFFQNLKGFFVAPL
jgi:hypothetical protein